MPSRAPVRSPALRTAPRGRTEGSRGDPVSNPSRGPVFVQAVKPIRAPIPQNAPRGRAGGNKGGPVVAPESPVFSLGVPYFNWAAGSMYTSG